MAIDFGAETSRLFAACDGLIGDTITIAPPSPAAPITLQGQVNYGDRLADFGETSALAQGVTADFQMASVEGKPGKGWIILFPSPAVPWFAGRMFEPVNVRADESGTRWVFGVKEVFE